MRIAHIEIQNFRKLRSVRIELSERSTLLVGANNSGKSSAMVALRYFLCKRGASGFGTDDFTLSHWLSLNEFGANWVKAISDDGSEPPDNSLLLSVLPSLDVWLRVENRELYYVRNLLPTLDWSGGLLGVRLRFEPKDIDALIQDFVAAHTAAQATTAAAKTVEKEEENNEAKAKATPLAEPSHVLWPRDFQEYLVRRLSQHFTVKAYLLDPAKLKEPRDGMARPQELPNGSDPIEGNPLEELVRVDVIGAQRGLGHTDEGQQSTADEGDARGSRTTRKLSDQLRNYYAKHLDPMEFPEKEDVEALQAIAQAQQLFDARLKTSFEKPISELEQLNYPGVTDPKLRIATRVQPTDGLKHSAAVQYEALANGVEGSSATQTLPEHYNGLGYQNLISMVFRLMSFRDAWMRVGKVAQATQASGSKTSPSPPPLHLVLVEEPEAHLHAQVQQVFVRKAYDVLREHDALKEDEALTTQMVVSTHSNHVVHESDFSTLRYFRRAPASEDCCVPTSTVSNLSEVFGDENDTQRFVARYLHATHCDLFFADAAILVEGTAERMLVPHFIKHHFPDLHRCYITLLEVGGSHAHRLRPLIELLGLTTLIVTDLDSQSAESKKAIVPKRGFGQVSGNTTLKDWTPKVTAIDQLIGLKEEAKLLASQNGPSYSIRVAYQIPIQVELADSAETQEMLARTFEDALVLENAAVFRTLDGIGMIKKFATLLNNPNEPDDLGAAIFDIVRDGDKGAFALDVLWLTDPSLLKVPTYIREGLTWLELTLVPPVVEPMNSAQEVVQESEVQEQAVEDRK